MIGGRKMKKFLVLLLMLATMVGALAGCSSEEETSDSGVVELTFATWAGGEELEEFQAIIDEVNEEHADEYHVTLQSVPSDYYMKMQTQLSAGEGPDLMWMSQEQIAPFAAAGALIPLDDYMASGELSEYTFSEETMKGQTYNGELYGVPWISNPLIMYYNKDIVDDADEAVLEATNSGDYMTWDEFIAMAKKYHDPENGKYGTIFNGWPPLEFFIWTMGGEVQAEDGTVMIDSPESVAGIELAADLIVNDPITPDMATINQVGYTETFQQGNTAFFFGGAADGVELVGGEPVPFEVGYAVVPMGTIAATYNWSAGTVITKDCENPDVAYQALEDITLKIFEWKAVPPVDVTELGYADYEDYLAQNLPQKAGMGATIEESMKIIKTDNFSADTAAIYQNMYDQIYSVILNAPVNGETVDVQTLVDNCMAKIEEDLK